jgi:hypothetical protein
MYMVLNFNPEMFVILEIGPVEANDSWTVDGLYDTLFVPHRTTIFRCKLNAYT